MARPPVTAAAGADLNGHRDIVDTTGPLPHAARSDGRSFGRAGWDIPFPARCSPGADPRALNNLADGMLERLMTEAHVAVARASDWWKARAPVRMRSARTSKGSPAARGLVKKIWGVSAERGGNRDDAQRVIRVCGHRGNPHRITATRTRRGCDPPHRDSSDGKRLYKAALSVVGHSRLEQCRWHGQQMEAIRSPRIGGCGRESEGDRHASPMGADACRRTKASVARRSFNLPKMGNMILRHARMEDDESRCSLYDARERTIARARKRDSDPLGRPAEWLSAAPPDRE